jgi:hypothetical protein
VSRVRTHVSLRRSRDDGGTTVLDYVDSSSWQGWYAHDFDWAGRYQRVRRCTPAEVRDVLVGDPEPDLDQLSEPRRSQQ